MKETNPTHSKGGIIWNKGKRDIAFFSKIMSTPYSNQNDFDAIFNIIKQETETGPLLKLKKTSRPKRLFGRGEKTPCLRRSADIAKDGH